MKLTVLGSSGSVTPEGASCSFLVGDHVAFEMGAAASKLSIERQAQLDDIFLTHAHLDHVKDLAFVAENVFGLRDEPIRVHGLPATLQALRQHILNGVVWPDFSAIPSADKPTLRYVPCEPGTAVEAGGLRITPVELDHPGGCVGYLIDSDAGVLVLCGDTGPTDALWAAVNAAGARVRALLIEASFPSRMHELAALSGHMTPALLEIELQKLRRADLPVYVHHIKAPTRDETLADLAALGQERIHVLAEGMELEF